MLRPYNKQRIMKTRPRTNGKKVPYGPNIVRAWFDTVFQYALRGLEGERNFLARRDWTFRVRNRCLEYLNPLTEHLPGGARDNLEQFVSFFPQASAKIAHHDACQQRLEENCRAYLSAILQDAGFRKAFERTAAEAPEELGKDFDSYFGAYSSHEDFMEILAEYLINNVEGLPGYYSTADLWNRYRDRFVAVISTSGLASYREMTEQSGRAMMEAVDDATSFLKVTRSELSLRFDLPLVTETRSVR